MNAEETAGQQYPPDGFVDYINRAHSGGIELLLEYIHELVAFLGVENNDEDTESMPSDPEEQEEEEQVMCHLLLNGNFFLHSFFICAVFIVLIYFDL